MPNRNTPRQIPFNLGHEAGHSRDDLIVTDANRDAVAFIEAWPDWPGPFGIVVGPAGSGKTHLATIWGAETGALNIAADRLGEIDRFGLAGSENVLIEDVGEAPFDNPGLFHLLNALRSGGGSILMTARRYPSGWPVSLPDLGSRLKASATVSIHEPDDLLLSGVIIKLFADRQLSIDPAIVSYLVSRMERSLVTAIGIVDKIDRMALERKARITRSLVAEALSAMDAGQEAFRY
jgi:chromosomal replication initiation ATPase DnaA